MIDWSDWVPQPFRPTLEKAIAEGCTVEGYYTGPNSAYEIVYLAEVKVYIPGGSAALAVGGRPSEETQAELERFQFEGSAVWWVWRGTPR